MDFNDNVPLFSKYIYAEGISLEKYSHYLKSEVLSKLTQK